MYTIDNFKNDLVASMKDNIVSMAIFGSAAIHDTTKKFSDCNTLLIVQDAGLATLKLMEPFVTRWKKQGNPPPLVFSIASLRHSQDVFAIEFFDIGTSHQILYGSDPLAGMEPNLGALRHQLEYELRSKLLSLQRGYFESAGQAKQLTETMAKSLSSFTVMAKTILRLAGQPVPAKKTDVWAAVARQVNLDTGVIDIIFDIREDRKKASAAEADTLYGQYLALVHRLAEYADKFLVQK